jgi:hippurate hydrolase
MLRRAPSLPGRGANQVALAKGDRSPECDREGTRSRTRPDEGVVRAYAPVPRTLDEKGQDGQIIADPVSQWGYAVETGIGKHGIVATMKVGDGDNSIGLRADFDALPIQEVNGLPYKSESNGVAHLCGHDGHSTMLLAAGKCLAEEKNLNGTLRLIFQPWEETMEGGPAV